MFDLFKRSPRALVMALAMHLLLVFFLLVGVDWLVAPKVYRPKVDVVQARVIDERQIAAEAARLKHAEEQIKAREQQKRQQAERELAALNRQRQQAQQRLEALAQKRKREERKRVAAEQARKAEEQKRRAQQAAEKKREAARKQAAAEKRRKAEQERQRKAAEARRQREAALQQALEAEQNSRALNAFAVAVSARVTGNWLRPPGTDRGLRCKLQIRLSARGTVLAVQLVQSSGNGAFDRSAEAAVFKSDPLPAPPAGLREINFTFDPDAR
jgi:colicin import membrane protein